MATIYTFHSHFQYIGNDDEKVFDLIEYFFKTFSQSTQWSASNRSTYIYTAGLMLRKAPASKIKSLIENHVVKFPEWMSAGVLWYANTPESLAALSKMTRSAPHQMYKMNAKMYAKRSAPKADSFNELSKSNGEVDIQQMVELLARWFINGNKDCLDRVLNEMIGPAVKPYMAKFLDEDEHLRNEFKEAKSLSIIPEALEMILEAKRYDTFLKEVLRKWL